MSITATCGGVGGMRAIASPAVPASPTTSTSSHCSSSSRTARRTTSWSSTRNTRIDFVISGCSTSPTHRAPCASHQSGPKVPGVIWSAISTIAGSTRHPRLPCNGLAFDAQSRPRRVQHLDRAQSALESLLYGSTTQEHDEQQDDENENNGADADIHEHELPIDPSDHAPANVTRDVA